MALNLVVNYEEGGENCLLHGDNESEKLLSEIVGAGALGELCNTHFIFELLSVMFGTAIVVVFVFVNFSFHVFFISIILLLLQFKFKFYHIHVDNTNATNIYIMQQQYFTQYLQLQN